MPPRQHSETAPLLAQRCLAHLDHEEAYLRQTRACLIELNQALLNGGLAQIESARSTQAKLSKLAAALDDQRSALCAEAAAALELTPPEVTLSRLATVFPSPWSERIIDFRDRLQPIVAEVHFLNNRNVALINYCRSYMQRIFAGAAKELPVTRYGPSGSQLDAGYGTLFVAMG